MSRFDHILHRADGVTTVELNTQVDTFRAVTSEKLTAVRQDVWSAELTLVTSEAFIVNVGDWIEAKGMRLYCMSTIDRYTCSEDNNREYQLTFYDPIYYLRQAVFYNTSESVSEGVYSYSRVDNAYPSVGTFEDFVKLCCYNCNSVQGVRMFKVGTVSESILTDIRVLTFSDYNCLAVLKQTCEEFETTWRVRINEGTDSLFIIDFGVEIEDFPVTLQVEKSQGLMSIEVTASDRDVFTQFVVKGGTDNLPSDYPHTNLQLDEDLEGTPPVYANSIIKLPHLYARWGKSVKELIFEDINPRRTGTVTGINEDILKFTDSDLIGAEWSPAGGTIHFVSGHLIGFTFNCNAFDPETGEITIESAEENNGFILPSETDSYYRIGIGDKYNVAGVSLPASYVSAAKTELKERALLVINGYWSQQRIESIIKIDPSIISVDIVPNMGFHIIHNALGINKIIMAKQVVYDLSLNYPYDIESITVSDWATDDSRADTLHRRVALAQILAKKKQQKGDQGVPGPAGEDGQPTYTWIKYADVADGTGLYDTPTSNTLYIGIAANKTTPTESTTKTDYTWSKFKGDQGVAGADGVTTYTWIKYASDSSGTGITDDPTGMTYIGFAYNKTTPSESNNPADYSWSLIKGEQGNQGVQGPPGANGVTTYTWIKYSDNADGTGLYDTPTANTLYIGIAVNKTTATESTVKTDYVWSKFKGEQGVAGEDGTTTYTWIKYGTSSAGAGITDNPTGMTYIGFAYNKTTPSESNNPADYSWSLIKGEQGLQGIQGTPGSDGITYYTWVRYADTPTTGMSQYPTGKSYIGFAYNKTTATESSNYADYKWSLIKGEQGIPGDRGADGTQYYTWIKYADTPTSGMSDSPTGKAYIGIAVNKTTATESTNYADYTWQLTKGEKGDAGVSITGVDVEFAKNTNPTTAPTTGWTTTAPSITGTEQLWTRTKTAYSSGNPTYSTPANITPKKGDTGAVGQGVESVTEQFILSSSKITQPAEGDVNWSTTPPTWENGKYIWSRVKVVYKNPASTVYTGYAVSSEWEAVNNLEIGGRNLVSHRPENWEQGGIAVATGAGWSNSARIRTVYIPIEPSTYYILTIYGEGLANSTRLHFYDNEKNWIEATDTLESEPYQSPENASFIRFQLRKEDDSEITPNDAISVMAKLEKGNKATDWTPAPEDVEAAAAALVDAIQVGGRNLLLNTAEGFYLTNSDRPGGRTHEILPNKNGFITVIDNVLLSAYGWVTTSDSTIDFSERDVWYTWSLDVRTNSDTFVIRTNLRLNITTTVPNSDANIPNTNGEWRRVSVSIYVPFGTTETNRMWITITGSNTIGATLEYKPTFKIEKGNKPTDWTPAPEDVEASIETAKTEAENAAKTYADTKSEAERVLAEAYADGKVSAEEQARIDDVNAKLAAAKAHAEAQDALLKTQQEAYADGKISTAEQAAIDAANDYADLKKTEAQAYADGIVSDEEARAIADATAKANAAQAAAEAAAAALDDAMQVGGRNLIIGSYNDWRSRTVSQYGYSTVYIPIQDDWRGKSVTHSFEVKDIPEGESVRIRIDYYRPDNTYTTPYHGNIVSLAGKSFVNYIVPTDTQYDRIRARIYPYNYTSNYSVLFRSEKLEFGNKATDWTPAPEDVQEDYATKLGYSNYADLVAKAKTGSTIISGGYLNTDLIEAGSIVAGKIAAGTITANEIEAGTITANEINISSLAADSAFITAITAEMAYIGGLTIGESKLYLGTGTYGNADTPFYVEGTEAYKRFSLGNKLAFDGTDLTINGGGTFSGALSAATGSFAGLVDAGGIKVGAGAISAGVGGLYIDTNNYWDELGNFKAGGSARYIYWNGTTFAIKGDITGSTGTFSGALSSASGTFGGLVDAGGIKVGLAAGGAGVNGLYINDNNYWYSTGVFKVGSSEKYLYFDGTNATFSGALSAASGTFTGSISVGGILIGENAYAAGKHGIKLNANNYWYLDGAVGVAKIGGADAYLSYASGALSMVGGSITAGSFSTTDGTTSVDISPTAVSGAGVRVSKGDAFAQIGLSGSWPSVFIRQGGTGTPSALLTPGQVTVGDTMSAVLQKNHLSLSGLVFNTTNLGTGDVVKTSGGGFLRFGTTVDNEDGSHKHNKISGYTVVIGTGSDPDTIYFSTT